MDVVRATTTMHISPTQMLTRGELFAADHPLVVAHPDWFDDNLLDAAHGSPRAEEPVRRGPGRPRKIETTERTLEVPQ